MNYDQIDFIRNKVQATIGSFPEQKISYILFFSPRSGSNLITTQLQSISFGNPFEAFHLNQNKLRRDYKWEFDFSDPVAYLQQAIDTLIVNDVFGMKINWKQHKIFMNVLRGIVGEDGEELNDFEIIEVFFPNVKYMFLKRRNKIKQAVSFSKGMQTGIWKATSSELEVHKEYVMPPRYDRPHIECCLDELLVFDEGWEQLLAEWNMPHHKIWYEDIAKDFTSEMLKIYEYLGVDKEAKKPEPVIKKLANKKSEEWYRLFVDETDWLSDKKLHEAIITGNTRYALTRRAGQVFLDRGEERWYQMPSNRFKKLRYYFFRIKKRTEKIFK